MNKKIKFDFIAISILALFDFAMTLTGAKVSIATLTYCAINWVMGDWR